MFRSNIKTLVVGHLYEFACAIGRTQNVNFLNTLLSIESLFYENINLLIVYCRALGKIKANKSHLIRLRLQVKNALEVGKLKLGKEILQAWEKNIALSIQSVCM